MRFTLIDHVLEQSADHIVAVKNVSLAEEYLADHFPTFAVLPGVMMLEAMIQAARRLLSDQTEHHMVLAEVKALKYASMVRPGEMLQVTVNLTRRNDDGTFTFKGLGEVVRPGADAQMPGETAVSGRFTLRPTRNPAPAARQAV